MQVELIVCWSRCLWCGRKTPHEVCHAHGSAFEPTKDEMRALEDRPNFDAEPEHCELPDGHERGEVA